MEIQKLEWTTRNDSATDAVTLWLSGNVLDDSSNVGLTRPGVDIQVDFTRNYGDGVGVAAKKDAMKSLTKKTLNHYLDALPDTTPNWTTRNDDTADFIDVRFKKEVNDTFSGADQMVMVNVNTYFYQLYRDAVDVAEKRTAIRALIRKALNQAIDIL